MAYIKRYTNTIKVGGTKIGVFELEDNLLKTRDEVVQKLTLFECKLLKLLVSKSNQIVKREDIEKELWENGYASEQSINNYIAKLRRYLSSDKSIELITISKVGYRLIMH